MQKLSKEQKKLRAELVAELRNRAEAITTSVAAYNEVVEEVKEFVNDITTAIEDYMGERSDKWREGERAEVLESWKSEWESLDTETIEVEQSTMNTELAEELENIPDKAE